MNTLIITHEGKRKKFQWKKQYNPQEFLSLLNSLFSPNKRIIGLKDIKGKPYEISHFLKYPKEALNHPYTLIFEGENISLNKSIEKNKSPYKSTPNKTNPNENNFKQKYLAFLETMHLENYITEKDYLFLKCLYFEETSYINEYFNNELNNYQNFCEKIRNLLASNNREQKNEDIYNCQNYNIKRSPHLFTQAPIPKDVEIIETLRPLSDLTTNKNVNIWVDSILSRSLSPNQMMILRKLIVNNDEMLFAAFKLFENERDEEELLDTVVHIIQKFQFPRNEIIQNSTNSNEKNNSYLNSNEKPKNNKIMNLSNSKEESSQKEQPYSRNNKEELKGAEDNKINPDSYFNNKTTNTTNNPPTKEVLKENIDSKPKKEAEIIEENKMGLSEIFNGFMEETGSQFEPHEYGTAAFLFKDRNYEMVAILKTCDSIELAVQLIKKLVSQYWSTLLNDNFSAEEKECLEKETKNLENEEIQNILQNFKQNSKIKSLLINFKQYLEKKASESKNTRDRAKTGFSNIVGQRILEKKTSFNLTLRRGQSFTSDQKSNPDDSMKDTNTVEIKVINFGENPELKEILNRFHHKQDDDTLNNKYKETLKEILDKADFIQKGDMQRYYEQLESNNPALLDICNRYSKNHNITKIKKNLISVMEKEDEIDFQASPLMKNKVKKLNSFKYLIRELFATNKVITKKQEKLFFYLYMEEDMSILSAYEVYTVTEDLQDFLETLEMIGKFHFFKTKLDFDEIEQFDEMVEKQLSLLFAYKKYLTVNFRNSLEKIIRAGDISLLKIYQEFKQHKSKEKFINSLIKLAEEKTIELQNYEKIIKENMKQTTIIEKRKETIENFKSTNFLKDCKYFYLIDQLVDQDHVLIQSIFEIYHNTKDKGDFIENIKLIYKWRYKINLKELVKPMSDSLELTQAEFHFLMDCIEEEMPNVMGPYELYMLEGETPEAELEFKDTLNIILRVYKREINIFEKSFYMACSAAND